ncbi:phage tail protein [Chitinophaga silvatica]|uniref:Phage tail protein n=1 Tax=Chitinophaga silvatica TaxID=2282649 RepID=A0A3E1YEU4_9BACT|nr:type VI secretion system tube protein TssD [Chitinophaga silvatica]RFS25031.1 phage tail protein [Chitinophaga silvatica]
MSFKAKLEVNGLQYNIQHVTYELSQEIDATGRPSAITRGGRIRMTVESTGQTELFEWMVNNFERKDGTITFFKRDNDSKLKMLEFKEGYLVRFQESFDYENEYPMLISFTISAREIIMGNAKHVNEWV